MLYLVATSLSSKPHLNLVRTREKIIPLGLRIVCGHRAPDKLSAALLYPECSPQLARYFFAAVLIVLR
jgi:hypothetical protein